MSAEWRKHPDPESAAAACAHCILELLDQTRSRQEYATLAVSGGATPRLLFQQFATSGFAWDRVHLFWVDEHPVPPTDPHSNSRLAAESFLGPAGISGRQVHWIPAELPPAHAAMRYVEEIQRFFRLTRGEVPQFDVVQLGMGADATLPVCFPASPASTIPTRLGRQYS